MRQDNILADTKLCLTAPLRYGGRGANMESSPINKHSAFRQVSASNPPQRKAANRYDFNFISKEVFEKGISLIKDTKVTFNGYIKFVKSQKENSK